MHNKPGKVRVNRARALRARDVADGFGTGTLFEQVYQHYKNLPRSHLRCAKRAFEVVFVGEGASDYGVRCRGVVLRLVAPTGDEQQALKAKDPKKYMALKVTLHIHTYLITLSIHW